MWVRECYCDVQCAECGEQEVFLRVWAVALIVAFLVQPVAARDGLAAPTETVAAQEINTVEVVLTEYSFGPSDPVVAPGTIRLRIINAGIRRHNVVMLVDGVELTSPEARPGDIVEWELQIDRPGRYQFWCGEYRHLEKGMAGTLIVG
jgi:plastocyanin